MRPKIISVIVILGALMAVGIDISQLTTLAIAILFLICAISVIVRGKWLPQFLGSIVGLLIGPCCVAIVIRILFAQLSVLPDFSLGWLGVLVLAGGLGVASLVSYFIVKRRLQFFQQKLPPVLNERRPVYAPRRQKLPGE
jgi:hypothetical protein